MIVILPASLGHAFARAYANRRAFLSDDWLIVADGLEEVGLRPLARALASVVRRGRRLHRASRIYDEPAHQRASARLGRLEEIVRERLIMLESADFDPAPRRGTLEPGGPVQVRHAWAGGREVFYDWFGNYQLIGLVGDRAVLRKRSGRLAEPGGTIVVYHTRDIRPDTRPEVHDGSLLRGAARRVR